MPDLSFFLRQIEQGYAINIESLSYKICQHFFLCNKFSEIYSKHIMISSFILKNTTYFQDKLFKPNVFLKIRTCLEETQRK